MSFKFQHRHEIDGEQEEPFVARIIIKGGWICDLEEARNIIDRVVGFWINRNYPKVKYLVTPGGFTYFNWPKTINLNTLVQ